MLLILSLLSGSAWATTEYSTERIVAAIYKAEGSERASVPYGIMWPGCDWDDVALCRRIAINTVNNQRRRHKAHECGRDFLTCLWHRYCPPSAHPLNAHWLSNVRAFLSLTD